VSLQCLLLRFSLCDLCDNAFFGKQKAIVNSYRSPTRRHKKTVERHDGLERVCSQFESLKFCAPGF
jgi:hypothetical protein